MPRHEEWDWPPPRRYPPQPQTIDLVRVRRSRWRNPNTWADLFGRAVFGGMKFGLILALGAIVFASLWFIGVVIRA